MVRQLIYYIKHYIGLFPLLCALLMLDKNLGFKIPFLYTIVNIVLIIIPIVLIGRSNNNKLDIPTLLFLLILLLSLVINNPDPVFRAYERLVQFTLILLSFSPLLQNDIAREFRIKVFFVILWGSALIGIISFFCYFLGINFMKLNEGLTYMDYNAGTFGGITTQSMVLGPLSGIGMLFMTYKALGTAKKLYWLGAVFCFASVMFAASRSAFIATLVGELLVFYTFYSSKADVLKKLVPVVLVLCVSYPLWNSALEGLQNKNHTELSSGIDIASRSRKWNCRLKEFNDSPVFGIGYATVSSIDYYDRRSGLIEPGSSWLAILSMTGSIGFIMFCFLFFRGISRAFKNQSKPNHMIGCVLSLLGVHMIAEGHIFSAGAYLCFMVWLTIGVATDCNDIDSQALLLETDNKTDKENTNEDSI